MDNLIRGGGGSSKSEDSNFLRKNKRGTRIRGF